MPDSDFSLNPQEADTIARLSVLEQLREQARQGIRTAMLANIEKLIEAELKTLYRLRQQKAHDESTNGA